MTRRRPTPWPTPASRSGRDVDPVPHRRASSPAPAVWPPWRRRSVLRTQQGPPRRQPVPAARHAAEHGRGPHRHRARHPGLQLVDRHRLRRRRPVDRRGACGCCAPARPTWWSAGAARRRCSRRSPTPSATPGRWPAAGPTRPRPAARSTAAATGWSSARAPACSSWNAPSTPRRAGAAGYADLARLGRHHRRAPPDHAPPRRRGRRRVHAPGAAPTPASRPATSATSTRTAPAPSSATSPRSLRDPHGVRRRRRRRSAPPRRVTGHMLGASGVVEAAVVASMALRRGLLPPTHNLDDPDPACDARPHPQGTRAGRGRRTCCRTRSASAATTSAWSSAGRARRHDPSSRRDARRAVNDRSERGSG